VVERRRIARTSFRPHDGKGSADALAERVRRSLGADEVLLVERLQSLWGGYGELWRAQATKAHEVTPVIVKHVHPPGGEQSRSHRRKLRSYETERLFYGKYAAACSTTASCRVPLPLAVSAEQGGWLFVLEDLDHAGYGERRSRASAADVVATLRWLAHFHARFLGQPPDALWKVGTYWHLATRPDELVAMKHAALRRAAPAIDARLNQARFKTWVHGDAKLENVCFRSDASEVALVDFQYVGGGVGVKDVAYFLSSCLSPRECESQAEAYLDTYFDELRRALPRASPELEREWRELYPFAWADFQRFLLGWAPGQFDRDRYANALVEQVLATLATP
jgi:hypothetical protein